MSILCMETANPGLYDPLQAEKFADAIRCDSWTWYKRVLQAWVGRESGGAASLAYIPVHA